MKRIFIAINLGRESKANLKRKLLRIQKTINDKSIKWIKPENIHLTLAFLGSINESRVGDLSLRLKKNLKNIKPFNLHIQGLGVFPNIYEPRIIWIGIKDHQQLFTLERRIKKALDNLGIKYDRKKFHAHLTVGRINSRIKLELKKIKENIKKVDCGKFKVKTIEIMSSKLAPDGAKHKIEEQIDL